MFRTKDKHKKQSDAPAVPPEAGPRESAENKAEAPVEQAGSDQNAQPGNVAQPSADSQACQEKNAAEEKYLRLLADFDNFRKRTARERADVYQRANAEIVTELLPVLDHLEMALESAAEHRADGAVVDGFKLVSDQLMGVVRKTGLISIEAENRQFDPMFHEAISHLPSDTVPENFVIAQVRKGYMLGGRMIRASRVIVSSGKPRAAQASQTPSVQDGIPAADSPSIKEEK